MYHYISKIVWKIWYTFNLNYLFLNGFVATQVSYMYYLLRLFNLLLLLLYVQYLTNRFFYGKVRRVLYCPFCFVIFALLIEKRKEKGNGNYNRKWWRKWRWRREQQWRQWHWSRLAVIFIVELKSEIMHFKDFDLVYYTVFCQYFLKSLPKFT